MGIFSDLFGKHGHRKDKVIQELLEHIKILEEEKMILVKNERSLIQDVERLERWLHRCKHPPKKSVSFDVVFP